ncbi:tryptophan halogenase family protein [Alteromonas macleodii]|uniref:tryptophan halogenase family protein n=1 Tax=Alteromonas macleodii TaxID=28108 RepID=UPI002076BB1D|nr:tryptophan halogenase family protein [Alteromonas macleodii]USI26400.1 tryptophan 7-halogenase [Alteromonas macleodii]
MESTHTSSEHNLRNIVILGGGTAGWITAGVIAATHRSNNTKSSTIKITLIEAPSIPIAGVGEGTWPSMRRTLKLLGVSETDFINQCNVTFKQGAKFRHWVTGRDDDEYYHPLVAPNHYNNINFAESFSTQKFPFSFDKAVCTQGHICDLNLAPKNISHREYEGLLNYAYHLDANAFALFLKKHCTETLGVTHIEAEIERVEGEPDSPIKALVTNSSTRIEGDLFIDCSGFKSHLIGGHFNVEYQSCKDILFCDKAITTHLAYDNNAPLLPYTLSSATDAGWIWDIGLTNRRGVGHVYSSEFIDQEQAKSRLEHYAKRKLRDDEVRTFDIAPGHRKEFWKQNCVAVGLSAGFLEPLEASSLVLVEMAAKFIAEQLPRNTNVMGVIANRFNEVFRYRWSQIIDFLKLHYVLSERKEAFWQQHRNQETWTKSLSENLLLWRYHSPWHNDFTRTEEVFPSASYQYVLYGMQPNYSFINTAAQCQHKHYIELFAQDIELQLHQQKAQLYDQRTLLSNVRKFGFALG